MGEPANSLPCLSRCTYVTFSVAFILSGSHHLGVPKYIGFICGIDQNVACITGKRLLAYVSITFCPPLLVHDCICRDRHRSCYLQKRKPPCWCTSPYSDASCCMSIPAAACLYSLHCSCAKCNVDTLFFVLGSTSIGLEYLSTNHSLKTSTQLNGKTISSTCVIQRWNIDLTLLPKLKFEYVQICYC